MRKALQSLLAQVSSCDPLWRAAGWQTGLSLAGSFCTVFPATAASGRGVGEGLSDYPRLYLDLPGHGGFRNLGVTGFDEMSTVAHPNPS